ncbi:3052_t:CDS:2, partial [Racocetra persica]
NNLLPFTSSNTASTYNIDHYECINKLLQGLKALSDCVNWFLQDYYGDLYMKLSGLSWGPFVPKPFGVFPMIAINLIPLVTIIGMNGHTSSARTNHSICLTFITPWQFFIYKKAGIEKGSGPIVSEQDLNNAQGLNHHEQLSKPKAKQIQIPSTISDRRQGYI